MSNTKYQVGDQVRIVGYGSCVWTANADKTFTALDIQPELVGQLGIVTKAGSGITPDCANYQYGLKQYALSGLNKTAWYHEDQLELVFRPPYATAS